MEDRNPKVDKIIAEIDDFLSSMPEKERLKFFIKMGFKISKEEKAIINEPEKYLREASISGETFNPGTLHAEKKIIAPDKDVDANHDLATIQEAIDKCQVAAEQKSAANQTTYGNQPEQTKQENWHPLEGTEAWEMIQFMKTPSKPSFTLRGTRHIPTPEEIERAENANYQLTERMKEYNEYDAEAEAQNEKDGIIYRGLTDVTHEKEEKHRQLIRLRAALATALKAALEAKLQIATREEQLKYTAIYGRIDATEIAAQGAPNNQITYGNLPNATQTTKELSFEEIMRMMAEKDFGEKTVTIVGAHPASNEYINETRQALGASTAYLKKILAAQSRPDPNKYK